jgi:hypothetical protein
MSGFEAPTKPTFRAISQPDKNARLNSPALKTLLLYLEVYGSRLSKHANDWLR